MCTEAKPGHDFIGFSIVFPNLVMATLITVNHTTDSHLMSTVPGCRHAYTAASGVHLYILYIQYILYMLMAILTGWALLYITFNVVTKTGVLKGNP